jgi:hypothetical protein
MVDKLSYHDWLFLYESFVRSNTFPYFNTLSANIREAIVDGEYNVLLKSGDEAAIYEDRYNIASRSNINRLARAEFLTNTYKDIYYTNLEYRARFPFWHNGPIEMDFEYEFVYNLPYVFKDKEFQRFVCIKWLNTPYTPDIEKQLVAFLEELTSLDALIIYENFLGVNATNCQGFKSEWCVNEKEVLQSFWADFRKK